MWREYQQSAFAEQQPEEKLSSLVWIPCPACRTAVRLSETVPVGNGLRVCAGCSR
jgi:hypothetical protein